MAPSTRAESPRDGRGPRGGAVPVRDTEHTRQDLLRLLVCLHLVSLAPVRLDLYWHRQLARLAALGLALVIENDQIQFLVFAAQPDDEKSQQVSVHDLRDVVVSLEQPPKLRFGQET